MAKRKEKKKIYVLDSSAILHDHNAINSFQEHDVAIPITVLEELDNFKKGNDTINYEAREFIRFIDGLSGNYTLNEWIPLNGKAKGRFRVLLNETSTINAQKIFDGKKADHKILDAALNLAEENPSKVVILVSKDINLRVKAKSLDLKSQDFETGKIKNLDSLYKGKTIVEDAPSDAITKIHQEGFCDYKELFKEEPFSNHYFILRNNANSVLAYYNTITKQVEKVEKRPAYGIKAKNAEQAFALHAILNPEARLVSLQGVAGTGKTLLALAGAIEQKRNFRQIYLARPVVPLSNKDIGYLPGDIKSKLNPYMQPLWDNLKFIQNQYKETDKEYQRITDMVNTEKLVITPLAYIRGRSLSNICFIVDEAQNLTPHEIKTIITRAGENTKIIFTGDIFQIDTPYLDSQSNGLSYMIDRLQNQPLYAHITLEKGERSVLANLANDLL